MTMGMGLWSTPLRYLSWEETDNCKSAAFPLKIYRFIPSEVISIDKAVLQFSIESFRGYTGTTAAESAHTHGVDIGAGGAHTHNVSSVTSENNSELSTIVAGYLQWNHSNNITDANWNPVGVNVTGLTDASELWVFCSGFIYTTATASPTVVQYRLKDATNTIYYPSHEGVICSMNPIVDTKKDVNSFCIQAPTNPSGKTWTLEIKSDYDNAGNHTISTQGGYWTVSRHTHTVSGQTAQSATHTHPGEATGAGSAHTHGMSYSIYESPPAAPSVSITINGTDRTAALGGPWTVDQNNIDIGTYLNIGQWNDIRLIPNELLRLSSSVLVTVVV